MSDREMSVFETRLEERLRRYAAIDVPPVDADAIAHDAHSSAPSILERVFGPRPLLRPSVGTVLLLLLLGLLLALSLAIVGGQLRNLLPSTPLARNGLIAYSVVDIPGRPMAHVHLIGADGTGDLEVAQGGCPTYSADGSTLTYVSGSDEEAVRQVAAADGSAQKDLPNIGESESVLSPDGTQIAWLDWGFGEEGGPTTSEVWLMTVADESRRLLVPTPAERGISYQSLSWSPDGSRVGYAVIQELVNGDNMGVYRLAIDAVDVATSTVTRVTSRPGTDFVGYSWSPDGQAITYVGLPDGSPLPSLGPGSPPDAVAGLWPDQDVFVINVDGTNDTNVTSTSVAEKNPSWSPNKSAIVYESFDDDAYDLVVQQLDGLKAAGDPVRGPTVEYFAWSPDSSQLLLVTSGERSGREGETVTTTAIRIVDARFAHEPTLVTTFGFRIGCQPSWQRLAP